MNLAERKLLVVEDDPGLQTQLRWCFDGYEVVVASDRATALEEIARYPYPVVTLDLGLPPDAGGTSEGFAALEAILEQSPHTKVIVVTGSNQRENALRAVGLGAYDFFYKPIDADLLGFIVNRACRLQELEDENRRLVETGGAHSPLEGVISGSPEMLSVCRTVEKVSPADVSVLLLGESGTGKEVLARAIHNLSARASHRFVAINCAAIPENLLESELFGYEKGAFTGAAKTTPGKFEMADQGTLFLDEVGDLPMQLQAKLLRFLQERVIERLGGRREIPLDLRVICATHKDLHKQIETGEFREDLFYRISEITIRIPPLRERSGDILLLGRAFLERFSREHSNQMHRFGKEALQAMEGHRWPGNVRELENRVKRAVIMADDKQITAADLELEGITAEEEDTFDLRTIRDRAERKALLRAMNHAGGKITQAAELLGISRPTMYDLLKKFGLK